MSYYKNRRPTVLRIPTELPSSDPKPVNVGGNTGSMTWGDVSGTKPTGGNTGSNGEGWLDMVKIKVPDASPGATPGADETPWGAYGTNVSNEDGSGVGSLYGGGTGGEIAEDPEPDPEPEPEPEPDPKPEITEPPGKVEMAEDTRRAVDEAVAKAMEDLFAYETSPFAYDADKDPLYGQYAEKYERQARAAAENAYANMAARSGGYGSSFAAVASQQAYNDEMDAMDDILPELYQYAYSRHTTEQNAEHQRLKDAYAMAVDERDYADGRADEEWKKEFQERGYNDEQAAAKAEEMQGYYNIALGMIADGIDDGEIIVSHLMGQGATKEEARAVVEKANTTWTGGYGEWYAGQAAQEDLREAGAEALAMFEQGMNKDEVTSALTALGYSKEVAGKAAAAFGDFLSRLDSEEDATEAAGLFYTALAEYDGENGDYVEAMLAGGGADEETIKTVMESVDQAWKAGYKDIAADDDTGASKNGMSAYEYVTDWMAKNGVESAVGRENQIRTMLKNAGYTKDEVTTCMGMLNDAEQARVDDIKSPAIQDVQDLVADFDNGEIDREDAVLMLAGVFSTLVGLTQTGELTEDVFNQITEEIAEIVGDRFKETEETEKESKIPKKVRVRTGVE